MDHLFVSVLLLLCSVAAASSFSGIAAGADGDPLILQVVDDEKGELALSAEAHFASFVRRFGKTYADEEERALRFKVFKANLHRAARYQRLDPTAIHGVTKFSDLTPAEFRRAYLGLRRPEAHKSTHEAPILPTDDLPTDFDWRDYGAVTGVKNQCDSDEPDACDQGCNGGLMTTAFQYLLKSGGLEREEDYPYTGTDRGSCKFDKSKIAASVQNFSVISTNEDQIAANLVKHGPLAIGINSVFMQTYIGGVSCPYICGRHLDHGVLLVGYGSAGYSPIRLKDKPFWIIKNSWGENWGEHGYYKICRGRNICGVDSMVSSVSAIHTQQDQ
ncbi:unnamed protein product [Musa acuminata subsp. burmannicoides]